MFWYARQEPCARQNLQCAPAIVGASGASAARAAFSSSKKFDELDGIQHGNTDRISGTTEPRLHDRQRDARDRLVEREAHPKA